MSADEFTLIGQWGIPSPVRFAWFAASQKPGFIEHAMTYVDRPDFGK